MDNVRTFRITLEILVKSFVFSLSIEYTNVKKDV